MTMIHNKEIAVNKQIYTRRFTASIADNGIQQSININGEFMLIWKDKKWTVVLLKDSNRILGECLSFNECFDIIDNYKDKSTK